MPAPPEFERSFLDANFDTRSKHFKVTTYIGLFLLAVYGIGDILNFGWQDIRAFAVRAIVIITAVISINYFTKERYKNIIDLLIVLSAVVISVSIFFIKYFAHSKGLVYYSAGYMITIAYYNIVIQPRFWYSFASSLVVYFSGLIFFYQLGFSKQQLAYIFFDSTTIIFLSLLSNYFIQLQVRKTFARKLLADYAKEKELLAKEQLLEISNQDSLTGLSNRRFFDESKEVFDKENTGVIFLDIDYFKLFNDNFGHLEGDDCIKLVANTIAANVREGDLLARYGGEEFVILMPSTNPKIIQAVAQRMIEQVEALDIEHQASPFRKVTVSLGWSFLNKNNSLERCLRDADSALYQAKDKGRNQFHPQ